MFLRSPCRAPSWRGREPSPPRPPAALFRRPARRSRSKRSWQGARPLVDALPRRLRMAATARIRRRLSVQVADQRVGGNGQQVRSFRACDSPRNSATFPISSSPATQACGSAAACSSSISKANSCRVRNFISAGTPALARRAFVAPTLWQVQPHSTNACSSRRRRPYRRRPGSCPLFPPARTIAEPRRPTPCLLGNADGSMTNTRRLVRSTPRPAGPIRRSAAVSQGFWPMNFCMVCRSCS